MNFEQKIKKLFSSHNFFIYIITEEEERLEYILNNISKDMFNSSICSWNFIDGYTNNPNYLKKGRKNPIEALEIIEKYPTTNTKFFLLKDYSLFINDLSIIRKLKNLNQWLKENNKYIIISSTENKIPEILKEYITCIKLPLPNKKEIFLEIERILKVLKITDYTLLNHLSQAYQGFSINKIRKSISEIIINHPIESEILHQIFEEKKN